MKPRLSTLFLLLSLFVALSANRAWACGNTDADHVAKFHHEHGHDSVAHEHPTAHEHSHSANSSDGCDPSEHPGQPCSDDEGGHCHCPGCGAVGHAAAAFAASSDAAIFTPVHPAASVQRQAFYFAEHLPEAVYLPIWQPPKLMA